MLFVYPWFSCCLATAMLFSKRSSPSSFDSRKTLSRSEARDVYDQFAEEGHTGGKDADSGYGGPAVSALLQMADFLSAETVLEYGCGQGKLAELVYSSSVLSSDDDDKAAAVSSTKLKWRGIDQSPKMVNRFRERCKLYDDCSVELLVDGDPSDVAVENRSIDRFVSTYSLDLLSEDDMYKVLDLAKACLHPERGLLLLAGITWGYKASIRTFAMTAVWELLYKIRRKKVGGCRPQRLVPYLESRGWRIEKVVQTMPDGFPWMVSEVVSARPPL